MKRHLTGRGCFRWALLALVTSLWTVTAAPFQIYPKAKAGAKPAKLPDAGKADGGKVDAGKVDDAKSKAAANAVTYYATSDDFARVAYFYRAIGKEQKMAAGAGDGSAHATFTFDGGETVVISHFRPSGDPAADQTFIEVHGGVTNRSAVNSGAAAKSEGAKAPVASAAQTQPIPKVIANTEPVKVSKPGDTKKP